MNKKYKFILMIMAVMLFLTSCGGGGFVADKDTKRPEATGESWTVMIYMPGGVLEEEYGKATEVLSSLSYDLPENINVLVETGGCGKWSSEEIKNDRIQDFAVQKNGIKPVYEGLIKNMGESDTYKEFIVRSSKEYPADRYISIIWGAGGGPIDGVTADATFNNDFLTVQEVSDGLADTGLVLDIIGFDGSLMSTVETAAAMSLYARYMVASEDILPIGAWNYRGLFEELSNNPSESPLNICKTICDDIDEWADNNSHEDVVMAVTDLAMSTIFVQGFETLARHMSEMAWEVNTHSTLKNSLYNAFSLGARGEVEGYSDLVDIKALADCVFSATEDDSARLDNIIKKAVVYTTAEKEDECVCGLGVFFPMDKSADKLNRYREISPSLGYMEYLERTDTNALISERVADYKETPSWQYYQLHKPYNSIAAHFEPTGVYTLNVVNPELIARAGVNIYKYDEELGKYMLILTDYDTDKNEMQASFEYEFKNVIFELNGTPVWAELVRATNDYELYSIPVMYNDVLSSIRVKKIIDKDRPEYSVIGVWQGMGTGGRIFNAIGTGDVITPVYRVFGAETGEYIEGKSLRLVFGGVAIKEKKVSDGDYMISYVTEDIYDVRVESNTTSVSALKGKFKLSN